MALPGGFSPIQDSNRRLQVVAEQVREKLEEAIGGGKFATFEALSFTDRYNDMMKEDCIKIKVAEPDRAILVYVEEAAVMVFPPQVNLLSYITDVSCDVQLGDYIEQLMSLRK